ncbi:hypothetical protein NE237_013065 [Protea cynaroides]|uniref:3'-5' exonuclease n=1 Tax=Protea cynaroides TaxID=273540 RepID=A0A9Q0JYL9_9MAGN|nr:hypothetical protein NE237_013065 [Protea cynaroides]
MESSGEPSFASVPDWDQPINQEELDAIEAAFKHADTSSSVKRRRSSSSDAVEVRCNSRRLPSSLVRCQQIPPLDGYEKENCSITTVDSLGPKIGRWNPVRDSYQAKAKVRYPTMNFGGRIAYCRTVLEVEKATMELFEIIETKKKNMDHVPLGFDIEWRPIFRRGFAPRKAAVIQICGDSSNCYVMHIIHSGIPPILQTLLEDLTSLKVGICIANDANKIFKDYNVHVKPLEDLSSLANLKVGGLARKWSLSSLTEMLTCKELEKPDKIRLGNWEADVLSRDPPLPSTPLCFICHLWLTGILGGGSSNIAGLNDDTLPMSVSLTFSGKQQRQLKAAISNHPLYEQLLEAHVGCLRVATPIDHLPLIDAQLEHAHHLLRSYASHHRHHHHYEKQDLDNFLVYIFTLISSKTLNFGFCFQCFDFIITGIISVTIVFIQRTASTCSSSFVKRSIREDQIRSEFEG